MPCIRPDWSTPENDPCYCDEPDYDEVLSSGEYPCAECHWMAPDEAEG